MISFAVLKFIIHLSVITRYDYFRDEFYYIACSDHPDFGYVDHPPLSILIMALIRFLMGDSLTAIRILPAAADALVVFAAGLLALELGGRRFAVALSCTTAMSVLGNYAVFHFYSMNAIDILIWQVLLLIMLRIVNHRGHPDRLWMIFGIIAGIGLLNKLSVLFISLAILTGLLATPERKHLKNRHLWVGAMIAAIMAAPYLLWNMLNGWPTLEFMHNASNFKNVQVSPLEFLFGQLLYNNPVTVIIWGAGLWYFLVSRAGSGRRIFGWIYLTLYLLMTLQHGKSYYMAGAYFILFAGGAVLWEMWADRFALIRTFGLIALFTALAASTLYMLPTVLPVLSPQAAANHALRTGISSYAEENHEKGVMPQHFADMFGWPELVEKVARVYNTLNDEQKKNCLIYGQNYGVTSAINFLGKKYNLPPAISGHNNYYFWKPKTIVINTLIVIGGNREDHLQAFDSVEAKDRTFHPFAMPYENNNDIFLCTHPKITLEEIWPQIKHFE